ncbi:Crp/Fnr family transcriptional regulator [Faunimonas sp. B44]|uniref:Crp/Fnr family transcriptional regulator n=1 Tax=Faunimonas sp. B44 TaxID=3461493 RepID=UPI004044EC1C
MQSVIHLVQQPDRCSDCAIRQSAFCAAVGPEDLARLNAMAQRRRYGAGDTIFHEEESLSFVANIITGVVKLSKTLADGRQQLVGVQFPGDFLGRVFRPRTGFRAEAATAVELCTFPRGSFERMVASSHELETRLFRDTLDELDAAREWMVLLGRQSAREKVARFLIMVARRTSREGLAPAAGRSPAVRFDLPLSRADIADFLGLTVETVSRQMTRLKTEGLIRFETSRRIEIPEMDDLELAAGG